MYAYGQRLNSIYPSAKVFEHPEGHKFPGTKAVVDSIAAHLKVELAAGGAVGLSAEQIAKVQLDCFAEDIPLPSGVEQWSEARLRAYLEAGGEEDSGQSKLL